MDGSLSLTLAAIGGRTRPTYMVAVPPLQCSPVRYDDRLHPDMACLTLLHLGGVLQGDQLDLAITLEPGAATRLTTAAATQVYRMPERDAMQATTVILHPGARLLYLLEPSILFAGARFTQTTRITLHEGATLALRELLVCGRLARGNFTSTIAIARTSRCATLAVAACWPSARSWNRHSSRPWHSACRELIL